MENELHSNISDITETKEMKTEMKLPDAYEISFAINFYQDFQPSTLALDENPIFAEKISTLFFVIFNLFVE